GTPLQGSHTLDDGYANGWEMWLDRRSGKRAYASGRISGADKFSLLAGTGLFNNSLRDQLVIRFDGDNVEFFARTYNAGATVTDIGDPGYTSIGGAIDAATGMAMLQGLDLLRIGARNNESEAHIPAGGNPDSILQASTFADVFRVYDRQLTDAELLQNFINYNGAILRIPEPATLTLLATGGLTLLRRRRAA
ncbi:MAG: PEP-CTERM sorting domain-containing protein, partial [Phycisphaeraceae bacterium]|nr:PEP-CTERM sorting domain-containing protein [Phycisphaeraceae bacterium]